MDYAWIMHAVGMDCAWFMHGLHGLSGTSTSMGLGSAASDALALLRRALWKLEMNKLALGAAQGLQLGQSNAPSWRR